LEKTTIEKLRIMLPHWIGHSHQHAEEFGKWAQLARAEGHAELAKALEEVIASMGTTDSLLNRAASLVGISPATGHGHSHEHHGHHDACCHGHHQSDAASEGTPRHAHGSHGCCHGHQHGKEK